MAVGDANGAMVVLRDSLAFDDGSADVHYNLGSLLLGLKRPGEAEKHFRAATLADPKMAQAHSNLGLLLSRRGAQSEAKAAFGDDKAPFFGIPWSAVAWLGNVMGGGGYKYGLYNYRNTRIAASTYHDAIMRHFMLWADGEDADPVYTVNEWGNIDYSIPPGSGAPHLAHIMACCALLLDAQEEGMLDDDRNKTGHMRRLLDQSKAKFKTFRKAYDRYKDQRTD